MNDSGSSSSSSSNIRGYNLTDWTNEIIIGNYLWKHDDEHHIRSDWNRIECKLSHNIFKNNFNDRKKNLEYYLSYCVVLPSLCISKNFMADWNACRLHVTCNCRRISRSPKWQCHVYKWHIQLAYAHIAHQRQFDQQKISQYFCILCATLFGCVLCSLYLFILLLPSRHTHVYVRCISQAH